MMETRSSSENPDFAELGSLVGDLIKIEKVLNPAEHVMPHTYPAGKKLEEIEDLLRRNSPLPPEWLSTDSRKSTGGIAISPADAARCLGDYIRTSRFIHGLYEAILDLKKKFPGEKIRILEAGSGPWALLSIAMASQFGPDEVEFNLADIHESSVFNGRGLIEKLGMQEHFNKFICGDICRMDLGEHLEKRPHIIVAEVMSRALMNEPQAAATFNLSRQMDEGGAFLPEKILVTAKLANSANQVQLGEIINLTRETALQAIDNPKSDPAPDRLRIEKKFAWPAEMKEGTLLLNTEITVYGDIKITTSNSNISHPVLLGRVKNPGGKKSLALRLKLGGDKYDTKFSLE